MSTDQTEVDGIEYDIEVFIDRYREIELNRQREVSLARTRAEAELC